MTETETAIIRAEVEKILDEENAKARNAVTGVAVGVLILVGSYYGAKRVTRKLVKRQLRKTTEKDG
jgi:hypothetical protein